MSDPLPGSATLTWTSSAGTISGGTLTDAIGNLAAGGTVTIHVSAVTPAGYSGTLADTATATASNNSPASVSASATDIVQAPDLTITKTGKADHLARHGDVHDHGEQHGGGWPMG